MQYFIRILSKRSVAPAVTGALLLATGIAAASASASSRLAFSATPLTIEAEVMPGQRYDGVVTVYNDSRSDLANNVVRLRVSTEDWTIDRKGAPNFARPGTLPGSCSAWVQHNTPQLTLGAKKQQQVRFTINVPPDARGLYRTALIFEAQSANQAPRSRAIAVAGRIATVVYLQVGPATRRARVTAFRLTPRQTFATIANTGNTHLRLSGTLQFRDSGGRVVANTRVPGTVILPGKVGLRDMVIDNPALKPAGDYEATLLLDYGGESLLGARGKLKIQ